MIIIFFHEFARQVRREIITDFEITKLITNQENFMFSNLLCDALCARRFSAGNNTIMATIKKVFPEGVALLRQSKRFVPLTYSFFEQIILIHRPKSVPGTLRIRELRQVIMM